MLNLNTLTVEFKSLLGSFRHTRTLQVTLKRVYCSEYVQNVYEKMQFVFSSFVKIFAITYK